MKFRKGGNFQRERTASGSKRQFRKKGAHKEAHPPNFRLARFLNNFARCAALQFAYTFKHLLSNKLELYNVTAGRREEQSGTEIGNWWKSSAGRSNSRRRQSLRVMDVEIWEDIKTAIVLSNFPKGFYRLHAQVSDFSFPTSLIIKFWSKHLQKIFIQ